VPQEGHPFNPASFDPAAYGRFAARDYDELYSDLDPVPAVDTLAELAAGDAVVEFGIGTGRLALPLAARGLVVHGIEGSPEMATLLSQKPGGAEIPVVVGDFAEVSAGHDFGLAVLAINTIYALPSQDAQVRCFRNGTAVRPVHVHDGHLELEVARLQPATQTMRTNKVHLSDAGVRLIPANHRYAWPSELDLMARLAGMRLRHRWENWARAAFQDASMTHVSVWERISDSPW
jgi:SAM-dependent methyltransferase